MDALHFFAYVGLALLLSPFIAMGVAFVFGVIAGIYAIVAAVIMRLFSDPY